MTSSANSQCSSAREIFAAAVKMADGPARQTLVERSCQGDEQLLAQVRALLAADSRTNHALENLAAEIACRNPTPDTAATETFIPDSCVDDASAVPLDVAKQPEIGPYKIREQIGEGGMGYVYVAEQTKPVRRKVALKVIKPGMDTKEVVARFEAERQALALMSHPNIAKVLDGGATDTGRPYFVMELVRGMPITQFCDEQQLSTRERLELFLPVCEAVQHAHMKGIIHRDLKPSNVIVELDDVRPVPKVIDFGVAKATGQKLSSHTIYTQFAQLIGTPLYMSPEQARRSSTDIDTRSDIYSLGVLLYELLTGSTPFDKEVLQKSGLDEMRRIICEDEPPRPSVRVSTLRNEKLSTISTNRQTAPLQLSHSLERELDWIVMKALEKDRERRYETANALAADLRRYLNDEPVEACPPSILYRLRKMSRRHRGLVTTGCLLAVALLIGAGLLLNERSRTLAALVEAGSQREIAEEQRKAAEGQEHAARRNESEALRQRDAATQNLYVAEIVSGQLDLELGYLQRLDRKLMNHLPLAGQPDRRGWEWSYLWSQCHPEVRTMQASHLHQFATWSPDGEYIGSSGDIWRAATGEPVQRISRSRIVRYRSAWSPDGRLFVWGMAADDCGIYVWDAVTDDLSELRGHTSSVWCLAFSPDGTQLASGGLDETIHVWNIDTGTALRTIPAPDGVGDVVWSPDGELLVAGSGIEYRKINVWKSATGEVVKELLLDLPVGQDVAQLSWHPAGDQLAVCVPETWCLLRCSDWTVTREHDLEFQRGRDLAWSPDGSQLAIADGEVVSLWDPVHDEPQRVLRGHLSRILNIDWSPDGKRLVTSDRGGEVKIWDLSMPSGLPGISVRGDVTSLFWMTNNETVGVQQTDGSTSLWNALDGQQLSTDPAISEGTVVWSPDRRLAACYEPATAEHPQIRILDAADHKAHAIWKGHNPAQIVKVAWSADGNFLAIAAKLPPDAADGPRPITRMQVVIWDVHREQTIYDWQYFGPDSPQVEKHLQLAWEPVPKSGRLAITALGEIGENGLHIWQGHIYVLDPRAGKIVCKHNVGGSSRRANVLAVEWHPDGSVILAGTRDGVIESIDVKSGTTSFSTRLHSTAINSLAWHPDGRRIVAASNDGSVKLLTADHGEDLLIFSLDDSVTHVAWNPAGNRLAAATADGNLHLWDASRADGLSPQGKRRGELALAYYPNWSDETPAEKQARQRQFLRLAPDTLGFWALRGNVQASLGEFDRAAEEYAKSIGPGLSRSFKSALSYASALLSAGKTAAYRRHCRSLFDHFKDTKVPSNGRIVVWLCTLTANDDINAESLLHLAPLDAEYGTREMLTLGAAQYRSGRHEEAAATLTDLVAGLERSIDVSRVGDLASALYFLAMARHRLDHEFQADRYLSEAATIANDHRDHFSWETNIQLEVLDRETRALIDGP